MNCICNHTPMKLHRENEQLFSYLLDNRAEHKYGGDAETGENFRIYGLEGIADGFLNLFENTYEGGDQNYTFPDTGYYFVGYWGCSDTLAPSEYIQTDDTDELIRFMNRFVA